MSLSRQDLTPALLTHMNYLFGISIRMSNTHILNQHVQPELHPQPFPCQGMAIQPSHCSSLKLRVSFRSQKPPSIFKKSYWFYLQRTTSFWPPIPALSLPLKFLTPLLSSGEITTHCGFPCICPCPIPYNKFSVPKSECICPKWLSILLRVQAKALIVTSTLCGLLLAIFLTFSSPALPTHTAQHNYSLFNTLGSLLHVAFAHSLFFT